MSDCLSPKTKKVLKRRGESVATFRACVLVLRDQIACVRQLLKAVHNKGGDEATRVHELRVACRRAQSWLLFFEAACPVSLLDPISKRLRKIRRATNEVRELDVLIENIRNWPIVPNRARLLRILQKHRNDAAARMRDELKRSLNSKRLRKLSMQLSLSQKENRDCTDEQSPFLQTPFRDFAVTSLRSQLEDYLCQRPTNWKDIDAIHRFRIQGKHARYNLELFSVLVPKKTASKALKAFVEIQTELGNLHDRAQGVSMIQSQLESADSLTLAAAWQTIFDRERRKLSKMQKQLPNQLSEARFQLLHRQMRKLLAATKR